MFGLGWPELLIILAVALLLFGGSRLAGVGKGTGRAIREFKEETRGLREADKADKAAKDAAAAEAEAAEAARAADRVEAPRADAPARPVGEVDPDGNAKI